MEENPEPEEPSLEELERRFDETRANLNKVVKEIEGRTTDNPGVYVSQILIGIMAIPFAYRLDAALDAYNFFLVLAGAPGVGAIVGGIAGLCIRRRPF